MNKYGPSRTKIDAISLVFSLFQFRNANVHRYINTVKRVTNRLLQFVQSAMNITVLTADTLLLIDYFLGVQHLKNT